LGHALVLAAAERERRNKFRGVLGKRQIIA
jgi:hypothetical protein